MMLREFLNINIPNPVYASDSIHDSKHKIFCNVTRKRRRSKGELVKFINEQIPMFLNLMTLC